jgi:hypothetical protein
MRIKLPILFFLIAAISLACASLPGGGKPSAEIQAPRLEVEVGQRLALSLRLSMPGGLPTIAWSAEAGRIEASPVDNEVDFVAPDEPGQVLVAALATAGGKSLRAEARIAVLPAGALKRTAEVLVEVDCNSLKGVWVDEAHPSLDFTPPLGIKGTFSYDPDSGAATAGGSWPLFSMYDDGTHGDKAAGDGIWSIRFTFRKSSSKVYFAFDDGGAYRVGYESGLAWRFKLAWRGVDEAGAGELSDENNLFFVPDKDQEVRWTAAMAASSGLYSKPAK